MSVLVIAAYHCDVAGEPTDSVDYQVRYFASNSIEEVTCRLQSEPPCTYENGDGEEVRCTFDGTVAIELDPQFKDGAEVIGFIAGGPKEATKPAVGNPDNRERRRRDRTPVRQDTPRTAIGPSSPQRYPFGTRAGRATRLRGVPSPIPPICPIMEHCRQSHRVRTDVGSRETAGINPTARFPHPTRRADNGTRPLAATYIPTSHQGISGAKNTC